jgi:hypothetical protein
MNHIKQAKKPIKRMKMIQVKIKRNTIHLNNKKLMKNLNMMNLIMTISQIKTNQFKLKLIKRINNNKNKQKKKYYNKFILNLRLTIFYSNLICKIKII